MSLREWLPVACQHIGWDTLPEPTYGLYRCNLPEALLPRSGWAPGPGVFCGMISLSQELMDGNTDKLCFVLAHELVHCFRYLTVVVPAFLDWPTFRDTTDCNPDEWLSIANLLQQFVDHYGGANELAEVKCYWPDDLAERWFRAMCS